MTELNDELLIAYIDGQLAKNQSEAVERVLEADQVAAQRVEALRAANAQLEAAFETMLGGEQYSLRAAGSAALAECAPVQPTIARRLPGAGLVVWVGLGCLLGGVAAGSYLHERIASEPVQLAVAPPPAARPVLTAPPAASLQDDVAQAHVLLSRDTFSLGLEAQGDTYLIALQLSAALGADLTIPDLSSENLTFQRAQMLQREGTPLAQIAYLPETGRPVALYVSSSTGVAQALRIEGFEGVSIASWGRGNLHFLLTADLPRRRLETLAKSVDSQLSATGPKSRDTGGDAGQAGVAGEE